MSVLLSTNINILIQFLTTIIGFIGLSINLKPEDSVLLDILKIELFVQIVEILFYIFVLHKMALSVSGMATMATARYFDWVITTPLMLFTTIIYFKYEEHKEKSLKPFNLTTFIKNNQKNIKLIFIFNLLMLILGYLGEIGVISITTATIFGFFAFILAFENIYSNYAKKSKIGKNMYTFLFIIWSLYGIAYLFPDILKNNTFNILDIFAKNFFGVFLYFKIKQVSQIN
jgi:bacteriorhodopsin